LSNKRSGASPGAALSVFRISEWSVRRKIVAVLAIPVALATVFGGLRVSSELSAASDYSTHQQRAAVVSPAIAYVDAAERFALPRNLAGQLGDGKQSPTQEFDSADNGLKSAAASSHLSTPQAAMVAGMLRLGDQLRHGTGAGIDATPSVQLTNIARYATDLVDSTLNTNGRPDPQVQALKQAMNGRLSLVKQQLLIQSATQESSLLGSVWLSAEIGVEGAALDNLKASYGSTRRVSSLIAANGTRLGEATTNKISRLAAQPDTFTTYDLLTAHLLGDVHQQLSNQASAAKSRALTDSGIIMLALLASLLLALFMARAVINPLRRVRAGALEVANAKLPATVRRIRDGQEPEEIVPINVHTHEDLGQLARAVDDMHRQAVNLATGEAQLRSQVGAMFVTLSRRNTTLVNQQLALIESLEQDEEDPQRLEQLFSLDHLATRMRRTAESLVILGGTQGRTAAVEELSVSDVVHAAVSEVQDYQRVRIDSVPDRMIAARAASDIVHLMAELIDNALAYSPPGSPVTIQAGLEDGRVEIEIIDSGLGMAGDQLAAANEQLKNGAEVTVDTARRMGLFVVSRLAEQHGLKVALRRNANGGGIIASIVLPTNVLVSDEPVQHTSLMDAAEAAGDELTAPPIVAEEPEDEEYDPYLDRIEEAIAAVTGLPRRRPGLNTGPEPVATPAAAVSMFDPAPRPELPVVEEPAASVDEDFPSGSEESEDLPSDVPAARYDDTATLGEAPALAQRTFQPWAKRDPLTEPVSWEAESESWTEAEPQDEPAEATAEWTEPQVPHRESTEEPAMATPEPPYRLTIRRNQPLDATAAASALEGDFEPDQQDEPSPIFGQLQSNWLSDEADQPWQPNEVDRGWDAAEEAESTAADDRTRTGLPVRRPGGRLVPGGVGSEPAPVSRDPEAIRNRLAAHAAGVSRGRAAAAAEPTKDDYAHEETGPA
jgi:signal transduction histidine kinase